MADPTIRRDELDAALKARRELGSEYEPEVLESFLERVEKRIDDKLRASRKPAKKKQQHVDLRLPLGSMALAVGATAIAVGNDVAWLAVIVWAAVAVINLAYARTFRG